MGALNAVDFAIETAHVIPAGGKIKATFPKWNPNAIFENELLSVIQGSFSCSSTANIDAALKCTFVNDVLTVIDGFSSDLAAGSMIQFTVAGVENPISTAAVTGVTA